MSATSLSVDSVHDRGKSDDPGTPSPRRSAVTILRRMCRARAAKLLCGAFAVLLTASCATIDPVTGNKVYNIWTIQDDIRMGADVYTDMQKWAQEEGIPINQDKERVEQLNRIMNDIAAVSHMPDLPYEVMLLETNMVNAFALPGGKFIVLSGLYDEKIGLVQDEDELAFVMAHEIAHVNCRHSTRSMTRAMPINLLLLGGAIYAEYKGDEDLQLLLGGAFVLHQGLVMTKYSRRDEREADEVGLMYMARAGYDPRAAVRLWERAAEEEMRFMKNISFLMTHPPSSERARLLRRRLPAALAAYEETKGMALAHAPEQPREPGPSLRDEPGPRWSRIPDPERALVSPRANVPAE